MTPAAAFRPAGPRFRLLFGETAPDEPGGAALALFPSGHFADTFGATISAWQLGERCGTGGLDDDLQ